MGTARVNPIDLLIEIIKEHAPKDIWQGSPLAGYRILGNTNRGEIGEEFVRRYLKLSKIEALRGVRTSLIDMGILDSQLEVKTASLGANGTFQFNHVRMDRKYQHLLCLGICPNDVVFAMWRKGDVAERKGRELGQNGRRAICYIQDHEKAGRDEANSGNARRNSPSSCGRFKLGHSPRWNHALAGHVRERFVSNGQ